MSHTAPYPPAAWNATDRPYRSDVVVADLLRDAARRDPDAPAVLAAEGTVYTYAELMARAERLARLLHDRGIGPGDYVAFVGRHRPETVVALTGISLSGAAFVPCHPEWPRSRVTYLLAATGARCVVGYAGDLSWIGDDTSATPLTDVVLLDVLAAELPLLPGREAVARLWDTVTRSPDPCEAAGFNLGGGPVYSGADVAVYAQHVAGLVREREPSSVLDIGFGSGLVLRALAPHVDLYAGLDPSGHAVRSNLDWADEHGHFVDLVEGFADEVADLLPGQYDVALLASTVQYLPDLRYLRAVLDRLAGVVRPGGSVVLADLIPPGSDTLAGQLVVPREFAETLLGGAWSKAEVRDRDGAGVAGELAHRYDLVLHRCDGTADPMVPEPSLLPNSLPENGLRVWTQWHLDRLDGGEVPLPGRPGDVAYVIFTSGSTGQPKGVSIVNTALVNMVEWVTEQFSVTPADRLLQVTSFCFDLSIYDVFGLLCAGGSIRLASEAELAEPARLASILIAEPITFWNSAPPMFAWVLPFLTSSSQDGPGRASMRMMFLAGDWIALTMPDEIRTVFPNTQIVNYGGATETTVWSTYYVIESVDPAWASIPYGRPMQNARFYVLDENREPCPIGVPGDLYAAGICLALGYHGDPAQTAQRFVPDPFMPGERMYNCGDRGLWRPDGELQFLGRVDQQVKIRGYRVELGEIESVMAALGPVREAVVVTVDSAGTRSLAGFWTGRPPGVQPDAMRTALAARLPEYMVPARLIALEELPLTSNGKADRRALAELARTRPAAATGEGITDA